MNFIYLALALFLYAPFASTLGGVYLIVFAFSGIFCLRFLTGPISQNLLIFFISITCYTCLLLIGDSKAVPQDLAYTLMKIAVLYLASQAAFSVDRTRFLKYFSHLTFVVSGCCTIVYFSHLQGLISLADRFVVFSDFSGIPRLGGFSEEPSVFCFPLLITAYYYLVTRRLRLLVLCCGMILLTVSNMILLGIISLLCSRLAFRRYFFPSLMLVVILIIAEFSRFKIDMMFWAIEKRIEVGFLNFDWQSLSVFGSGFLSFNRSLGDTLVAGNGIVKLLYDLGIFGFAILCSSIMFGIYRMRPSKNLWFPITIFSALSIFLNDYYLVHTLWFFLILFMRPPYDGIDYPPHIKRRAFSSAAIKLNNKIV